MKRVLVVDDNADERSILRIILERQGFEVIEARDGREGLETALLREPDIVISDALMPNMDGFQFLREMKKDTRLKSIPFIFYSAVYTGYKEAELALFLGAEAFIVRPKEPEEFWKELSCVLEGGCAATKNIPAMKLPEEDEIFLEKYSQIVVGKLLETVADLQKTLAELKLSQRALEENEERLRMAAYAGGIGTFDINVETGEAFRSAEMKNLLGLPSDAPPTILLNEVWQFVHPDDIKVVKQAYSESLDAGGNGTFRKEFRVIRENGEMRWFLTRGRTFFEDEGGRKRAVRTIGVILDITERKRAEESLRESEERFLKIASTALDAVILMDSEGNASFWNDAAARMFGYTSKEVEGKELHSFIMPERYRSAFKSGFEAFRSTGKGPFIGKVYEIEAKRKSGTEFPVEISLAPLQLKGKWNAIGIARDISERKQLEGAIRHMGTHDALTGLPNQRLFRELIGHELAQADRSGKKASILFLDLDRFKEINETLGHHAGDSLLREAGERIRNHVKKSDPVARIGADEFNILVTDINRPEDSAEVARDIVNSFRKPFIVAGHELNSTACIGISTYPDDSKDPETLFRYADIALHHAKELGNNYRFYESSINVISLERMQLRSLLQRSIASGQIVIYYQPLVHIPSGRMVSAEALVRWKHPRKGILNPEEFIPAAEETGFISTLDEWTLKTVCRQIRSWMDSGVPPIRVSVNLSARQFQDPGLINNISVILHETRLPADCLDLEITETIAMANIAQSVAQLEQLSKKGIHISIDDFGTGYSSLNYLKRLPIERIKIDKTFIQEIASDPDDRSIVQAVIAMAHNMRIKVVAEGVETREQLEFLQNTGCDEMQGFLYSEPVAAEKLMELVSSG